MSNQSKIMSFLDRMRGQVAETSLIIKNEYNKYTTSCKNIAVIAIQTTSLFSNGTRSNVNDTREKFTSNLKPI